MRNDEEGRGVSHLSVKVADLTCNESANNHDDGNHSTVAPLQPGRGQDITEIFTRASNALNHGQLVKDDFFTLFESVAALEIMDPKMDSGCSLPDEDSVLEDFDPLNHTLPEEVLWIMDELLCFEMAWHDGNPLSQTLFTSLHLNSLLSSDNLPLERLAFRTRVAASQAAKHPLVIHTLRAYCLGLAKCCDFIIQEIVSEHFYEEEDFITANFTRDLVTRIPEGSILATLDDAMAELARIDLSPDLETAIRSRLQLRKSMVQAFRPIGLDVASSDKSTLFKSVRDLITSVDASHVLCKATPTPVFSERVQRHLASNTPPRPIKQTSWDEAKRKLLQICEDTIFAFDITKLSPSFTPHALMRFAWEFTSRKPQPITYSRAIMQGLLFKSASVMGQLPHPDLLLSDIRSLVLPASDLLDPHNWQIELPSSPRYEIARRIDEFLARSMDEYLNLYRMALQNRCRIRRTFAQSIAILDSLQAMAEEFDGDIVGFCWASTTTRDPLAIERDSFSPLAAWVYHHKLQAMQVVVQMGFELELYLPDELAASYALLSFFAETHRGHCATIISVLESRLSPSRREPPPAPARREICASISFLEVIASQSRARFSLASALADLYTLMMLLGLIPYTSSERKNHSLPALRHELRLKPFLPIGTPILPSHEQLDEITTARPPETTFEEIREEADFKLRIARTELVALRATEPEKGRINGVETGWREEIKVLTQVAVEVAVSLATLAKVWEGQGIRTLGEATSDVKEKLKKAWVVEIPAPEQRRNVWWVVPKVAAVKSQQESDR
ncbi:Mak10-domain-containing protein [Myriangium duriaei CBS 260.36]|uniref:Mak10-domain-containing protein n=1 Tax=Myriangium duriaei CBS 260.36 TaxID=1168546 RepID=A0A9P4J6X3_9PEZI|nr:Mak10-domain-containing protein [Myriangium duriaei CBS 260.36]